MSLQTRAAALARRVGLGLIVDAKTVREMFKAPIYNYHRNKTGNVAHGSRDDAFLLGDSVTPELSVIVPAYNVEDYLSECLESILAQSYTSFEVIIVNDGSTDSTPEISDSFAAKHKRVRTVHKTNAGLGAARNTGISEARGRYITFVDSDDKIEPGAYETAMRTLVRTGSDVAIGAVSRFDSRNTWTPFWVKIAHDRERLAITGHDFPGIMWDVFAWNKIYKRDTWDASVGTFPEGLLYEDQECTAKLFTGGAKLDVLTAPFYRWRLRDDNSSITQQKTNLRDLQHRILVAETVASIISKSPTDYIDYWYTKTLGEDFYYYIKQIPRVGDEYLDQLSQFLQTIWNAASDTAIANVPPARRWLAYLASTGDRQALSIVLAELESSRQSVLVKLRNNRLRASLPLATGGELSIAENLRTVEYDHLTPVGQLDHVEYSPEGTAVLAGYAYVRQLDARLEISAELYEPSTETIVASFRTRRTNGLLADTATEPYIDRTRSRFEIEITPADIDSLAEDAHNSTPNTPLRLRLVLTAAGHTWVLPALQRDVHSSAGDPGPTDITAAGNRIAVLGDHRSYTDIVALTPRYVAKDVSIEQNVLRLTITDNSNYRTGDGNTPSEIVLRRGAHELSRTPLEHSGDSMYSQQVLPTRIHDSSLTSDSYSVELETPRGLKAAVAVQRKDVSRRRTNMHSVAMTGYGYFNISRTIQGATADSVFLSKSGQELSITGTYALDRKVVRATTPSFALVGSNRNLYPTHLDTNAMDNTFHVTFSLITSDESKLNAVVEDGRYIFQMLLATGKAHPPSVWATASHEIERTSPVHLTAADFNIDVVPVGRSRSVRVDLKRQLDRQTETGRWNENRLATASFSLDKSRIIEPIAVFESFAGQTISDSPLALSRSLQLRRPDIRQFWTVTNPRMQLPDGAQPLVLGSKEWFDRVSSAQVLVNNNNFPRYFKKSANQIYIQTWHGTPLKRIGNDVPPSALSLRYRELMAREANEGWNLLLAQSAWASLTLEAAFSYKGPVASLGYPRNDALADPDTYASLRSTTRQRLGISGSQRAVLYAPTWRDNLKEQSGNYSSVDLLDVNRTSESLGSNTVILYRGHSNTLSASRRALKPEVIDVSRVPDINSLIAASDTLVTDYSSIMFDYAVTRKPMLFLCPDMEQFATGTRGLYLDFGRIAPGPVFTKRTELVAHLKETALLGSEYHDRYTTFAQRFAPQDDGQASDRVWDHVNALFGVI